MMQDDLIYLLKNEVIPTTGCTDPAAISLTAAYAASVTKGDIHQIKVILSSAILKNARSVGIPGTSYRGIKMAVLLGVSMNNPRYDLTIFSSLESKDIQKALLLKTCLQIDVEVRDNLPSVYVEVSLKTASGMGMAIIEHRHNNLVLLQNEEKTVLDKRNIKNHQKIILPKLKSHSLEEIIDNIQKVPAASIEFLIEGMELNVRVAKEGLTSQVGLGIGLTLNKILEKPYAQQGLSNKIATYTAAACDARMSGVMLPIISSAGSGNQGLVAILPIAVVAEELASDRHKIIYALAISHLVTIYVKEATGRLAPICGCGVAAGAGAAAGLTYLLGGDVSNIGKAITIVISTMAGMICDGAKEGCALKLWAGSSIAWQAALLGLEGFQVPAGSGIVGSSVQKTLENLEKISRDGMKQVNKTLLSCFLETVS